MSAIKWLLRVVFIRMLGRRAVPVLAVLGVLGALRGRRSKDVAEVDPKTGRVRMKGESRWR